MIKMTLCTNEGILFVSPILKFFAKNSKSIWETIPSEVIRLAASIDEAEVRDGEVIAKFFGDVSVPLTKLSSGCLTAILISYYRTLEKPSIIDLRQTGENALKECLKLLDATELIAGYLPYYTFFSSKLLSPYQVNFDGEILSGRDFFLSILHRGVV